jgi:hypothetical protein
MAGTKIAFCVLLASLTLPWREQTIAMRAPKAGSQTKEGKTNAKCVIAANGKNQNSRPTALCVAKAIIKISLRRVCASTV